jgi:hypothetical protein
MEIVGPIMMASLFCDAGRSTAGYNLKIRHAKSELRTLNLQKWYKHYFSCFFRPRVKAQRTSARRRLPTTLDGHHASPPPTHHHQIVVRASSPLLSSSSLPSPARPCRRALSSKALIVLVPCSGETEC